MADPSAPACANCYLWGRDRFGRALGGYNADGSASECRKRAPIARPDDTDPFAGKRHFPFTKADDWCGEFLPSPPKDAAE